MRKRRKGKQVLYVSLLQGHPFSMKQLLGFLPARKKNETLKVQLTIGKRNNQYHILALVGTPALTASKHAACQQTALRRPAMLILQMRGGGKRIFSDRVPHLEARFLHLLLEASTCILGKMRETWNYQHTLRKPMACCGSMPPGRDKFPWAGARMR